MEILVPLFFAVFITYFVFSIFTKKGKGRLLGGRIIRTIDTEIKQSKGITRTTIRAHVINTKHEAENSISIELNQHAFLGWSMNAMSLTKSEAKILISMLQEAANG